MEHINKIIYINLDRRVDRNREMITELVKMGIHTDTYERFPAIVSNPGIIGCGLSHKRCLQTALDRNYSNILILEDDFEFIVSRQKLDESLRYVFDSFKEPWDVIMLGYNLTEQLETDNPVLGRVQRAQTASGYIVRSHYYQTLIDNLGQGNQQLQATGAHWLYANDVYWFPLQRSDKWFYFKNRIGKQRQSVSDTGYFSPDNINPIDYHL
jgi:GR25 family glycosyltransferase involved in LPS biosynthesis